MGSSSNSPPPTASRSRRSARIRPDTPRGGIVVAQEIFGVNSHIRSVCDGFAADGYVAIAPALFDRYERGVDMGYTPEDIARGPRAQGAGRSIDRRSPTSPRRAMSRRPPARSP